MKAQSVRVDSPAALIPVLANMREDGFRPTLAITFVSIRQDRDALRAIMREEGIAVFGATTHGEFIDETLGSGGIAVLFLDMPTDFFQLYFEPFESGNYREVTRDMARRAHERFARPAFLIAGSDMATDAEALLNGFEDVLGPKVNVFGGMAGDDYALKEQFVFTGEASSNNGAVVLALDEEKLIIKGKATGGWKPVGTAKTVTRSEGNRVYTIDDVPALDLTLKYAGLEHLREGAKSDGEAVAGSMEILTTLTLQLQREVGDPVLRPGLIVNWDDGSFYCSGTVPQGSKVRFSLPPDFDVMEEVIKGCEALKAREMPDADALVVFSCGGRILSLGPMMNMEIEGIRKVWNVPMAGMFSSAELARATHGNLEMHNLTTCCVALKER